jgi:hypothetical protein
MCASETLNVWVPTSNNITAVPVFNFSCPTRQFSYFMPL